MRNICMMYAHHIVLTCKTTWWSAREESSTFVWTRSKIHVSKKPILMSAKRPRASKNALVPSSEPVVELMISKDSSRRKVVMFMLTNLVKVTPILLTRNHALITTEIGAKTM